MRIITLFYLIMLSGIILKAQNGNYLPDKPRFTSESQTINLNQGWAGISSYLDPTNPEVANLMSAIEEKLIILQDFDGNYYQPSSRNSLLNWDFKQGYFIKIASAGNLEIEGLYPLSRQFELQTGWNLIPVLSDVSVQIEDYFFDHLDKVQIVTEVAGVDVFWPEMDISTLEVLAPGKAYLVKAIAPFALFQLPEVVTEEVTNITINAATCGGEVLHEGSSAVTERGLVWSTSENPTIDDNEGITYNGEGAGSWLSELAGLNPQTNYFVRAFAKNHVGTAYAEQEFFITTQQGTFTCGDPLLDTRDGQSYETVQICNQCWMAENLNIGNRIDGNSNQTNNGTIEKYCYSNSERNCSIYGGLYQWNEMMGYSTTGVRGICPDGWHLPTDSEWTALTTYLGGESGAGGKMKETGTAHWISPNTGATNSSGFTALPGGSRFTDGSFYDVGIYGYWWSSRQDDSSYAWYRYLCYNNASVLRLSYFKSFGFSVRCLKDN